MKADCHIHMVLDGENWKEAIARHKDQIDADFIRKTLKTIKNLDFLTFGTAVTNGAWA